MIPLVLGTALARLAQKSTMPNIQRPGQAPPPQVPLSRPTPGPQAPQNPTGELPPRPVAPPPRVVDAKVPPPIATPTQPTNDVPTGPLSAREAARIALRLQPTIQAARGQARTAEGGAIQTGSALLPQVGIGAGYYNARINGGLGSPVGTVAPGAAGVPLSTTVSVSQLLFDFGYTRNLVRQDRALAQAADAGLDRAALTAVKDVENAFYNLANDARLVAVSEADVENRQRQLNLARARFTSGIGTPIDVVTAETSKSQAVVSLIAARDAENQDRIVLLGLIGLNPLTPLDASQEDEPAVAANDPRELISIGVQRRPEIRAAVRTVVAYKYGVDAAKATDLPRIVGTLGGGLAAGSLGGGSIGDTTAIGIGLQFPIFDGGRRRGAIIAANGQLTTAQANLRSAVLQVQSDVASAYLGLLASEQRVVAAGTGVANAQEGVRIAEGRYANGLGLFLDITTAEAQLITALTAATDARNALNLARLKLRYATGSIL